MAMEQAGLTLAACCDRDLERAKQYQSDFGFERAYSDIEQMLAKEKPTAMCLVLPGELMCDAAVPLLERGYSVLMEKPPGKSSAELRRLIAAADKGGGLHLVGFNRRFMSVMSQAREILERQAPDPLPRQFYYEMLRTGRREPDFSETAVHAFDAALFLARSPFQQAALSYHELPGQGPGVANYAIDVTCVSGDRIHFDIQPVCGLVRERVAIHRLNQSVFLRLPIGAEDHFSSSLSVWENNRETFRLDVEGEDESDLLGFRAETVSFLKSVGAKRPTVTSLQDCRQQVRLMEAMRNREVEVVW
jgi:predicted dehydrogenase